MDNDKFWRWLTLFAFVFALFTVAVSFEATAADAICLDPPDTDQTMWDGQDGTLSY